MSPDPSVVFDATLPAFKDIPRRAWRTLLLGNGYSINLWSGFRYDKLRDEASLSAEADDLFVEMGTDNFEEILDVIHHAHTVLGALGKKTKAVDHLYAGLRDALFDTIQAVHVPWDTIPVATHECIADSLDDFDRVFTTNYDLTVYWSYVRDLQQVRIADFFWSNGTMFSPASTGVWDGYTALHYLHGAIHLWQDTAGQNGKWTNADGGRLLDLAKQYAPTSPRRPLFVSEGTASAKMRAVRRSPYLAYCYDALETDGADTLVLGHSLSASDNHIVRALASGPQRDIAVSMYSNQPGEAIVQAKARITASLKPHRVHFFDSQTHPLANPSLGVG